MLHAVSDVRRTLLLNKTWSAACSMTRTQNSVKERDPICAGMNEIAQHQFAGDRVNPSCSGQIYSNRPIIDS